MTEPKLYVGTFAKYNSGSIAGAWLCLSDYNDRDEFIEACEALHSDESDPEIMYQDSEGIPDAWYSEATAPPAELWEDWLDMDESERDAFSGFLSYDPRATLSDFRDAYQGTYPSEADFCEEYAENTGAIPANLPTWICIDWQASWDCNIGLDSFFSIHQGGEVLIFARL